MTKKMIYGIILISGDDFKKVKWKIYLWGTCRGPSPWRLAELAGGKGLHPPRGTHSPESRPWEILRWFIFSFILIFYWHCFFPHLLISVTAWIMSESLSFFRAVTWKTNLGCENLKKRKVFCKRQTSSSVNKPFSLFSNQNLSASRSLSNCSLKN